MASSHVLCVPREDDRDQVVLLNLVNRGSRSDLELEIEGTEGELPYVGKFSHEDILSNAASSTPASTWQSAILATLLQEPPSADLPLDLTVTASIHTTSKPKTSTLTLAIRPSNTADPLGSISMRADPAHEIDTLSWTATAVRRGQDLAKQAHSAKLDADQARADAQQRARELDEARRQHQEAEDKILRGFVAVLNAKKAKIRQLERAVAALRVGGGHAVQTDFKHEDETSGGEAAASRARTAEASRKGKRKASQDVAGAASASVQGSRRGADKGNHDSESSESDSGFESMRRLAVDSDSHDADDAEDAAGSSDDDRPPVRRGIGKLGGIGGKAASKDKDLKPKSGIGKIGGGKSKSTAAAITSGQKTRATTAKASEAIEAPAAPQRQSQVTRRGKTDQATSQSSAKKAESTNRKKSNPSGAQSSDSDSDAFEPAEPERAQGQISQSKSIELPPTRDLPFDRRDKTQDQLATNATNASEDESTTSDDEL